MKTRLFVAPVLAGFVCFAGFAQSSGAPKFGVDSVKPADPSFQRPDLKTSPGSLMMRNKSMIDLIQWAYDTPPFQIQGPDWLRNIRFDVIATAEGGGEDAKLQLMLQSLLADRFGMKAHWDQTGRTEAAGIDG